MRLSRDFTQKMEKQTHGQLFSGGEEHINDISTEARLSLGLLKSTLSHAFGIPQCLSTLHKLEMIPEILVIKEDRKLHNQSGLGSVKACAEPNDDSKKMIIA